MSLDVETRDGVMTLRLNRPDARNAVTEPMSRALIDALRAAAGDDGVRCIRLMGAGAHFCAGHDLKEASDIPADADEATLIARAEARLVMEAGIPALLARLPKPTLACVRGSAAGTGVLLAAACDIRLASDTARFKLAFAANGRCGDAGGANVLTRAVGPAWARDMYLLDDWVDAAQARAIGLVTRLAEDAAFDGEAQAIAERLASRSRAAVAVLKRNLNAAAHESFEQAAEAEALLNVRASFSGEAKAATQAFLQARRPKG